MIIVKCFNLIVYLYDIFYVGMIPIKIYIHKPYRHKFQNFIGESVHSNGSDDDHNHHRSQ